jgi:WD40 repeat protein/tetratricopeptide (TPR) repeat protein
MSLAHETGTSAFPYPGLRPYDQSEADLFFGREEHVDQLLGKLEIHRFLAVIGPSGCGKSSLVRAGLSPAMETGFMASAGIRWRSAVLRPESEPLRNLAKALLDAQALGSQTEDLREELGFLAATLRRGPLGLVEAVRAANLPERTNLLVLVDQFEELFRFHRLGGTSESNAFVDLLLASAIEPSESIYVVLTMRSDYLGNCPVFRGLPEAMNESQFLTPRLTREQNLAAIVGPAAMFGVKVEPEVVTRILNEMGTDPDQLPLMQHLLMRMWRRATQGRTESDYGGQVTLTMDDYEKVGGLASALSTHIERIYQELPDGGSRKIAETAFRNLTEITPDGQVNRRPVKVSEISEIAEASTQEIADVLDEFRQEGRSFLMPPISTSLTQDSVIDISHESLIRQWKRLKEWTREEDKARQTARSVKGDLGTWKKTRQNEQALLHGLRLVEAEEWAKTHPHQVELEERDFLKLSRDLEEREARVKRWLGRAIAILVGVLALVFLRFWVVSSHQLRQVQQQAESLEIERKNAVEAETRAKKLLQENIETKAEGLAAASRRLLEQRNNDPAGALALAVEAQNTAKQVEAECPTEVEQSLLSALCSQRMVPPLSSFFSASADNVTAIALSPDGQWIATGGGGSAARLWGLDPKSETTRMSMVNLDGHSHSVDTVALSEGSPRVATLDHEGVPRLWVTNGTNQATKSVVLKNRSQRANVIALSRDGTWLVAGCKAGEVRLWHLVGVDNPVPGESLAGHSSDVVCVTFDENSRRLATADDGGGVKVWDLSSPKPSSSARELSGHSASVQSLAFSRDGSTRYWNLGDDTVAPEVFRDKSSDESSPHLAVCVSPDGQKIATGCSNGIVLIWDANDPKAKPRRLPAASSMSGSSSANPEIGKLAFSPGSGRWLAAMDYGGRIWLWDLGGETPLLVSLPEANPNTLAPNRESGFVSPRLPSHLGGFAFTADAQTLMTINGANGLLSWDLSNFAPAEPFDPFSPRKLFTTWTQDTLTESDGAPSSSPSATTAERDGRLWSAAMADTSASPVFGPRLQSYGAMPRDTRSLSAAAFSPDGRTVALPAADGTIKLWDAARLDPTASRQLGHLGPMVNALAFSPSMGDGEHWLASGDQTGIVKLWDLSNPQADDPLTMYPKQGRNPRSLPTPIAEDQLSIETALAPPEGGVLALAFSPDGRWLACSSTSELWFWDLKQSPPDQPTVLPVGPFVSTNALAFHPTESSLLAAGGSDGKVLIWNLSDLKAKDNPRHLSGHSASITRLLFTADGLRLISASEDGVAQRWPFDRLNADEVHPIPLDRLNAGITCLAMSTKAKEPLLAIGGADGDVRLYRANAEDSEPTPVTRSWGSNSSIVDLAFSDDGRRLAVATDDRSVHVVYVDRAKNPESSVRLEDQDQITTSIVLTRDDRLVFAAGPQGTIRVWPLRWTPKLDELASLLAVRNLSAAELEESFPNQTYHKTFRNLPIHFSLIESARLLAKNGQMAQATQRLEELLANDPKLRLDPGTEVKLSYAGALIENGRKLASHREKPKAISQFREAQKLVPGSLDDPQEEADKNELMGMAAEVKQLVLGIRKQLDTNNRMDQFDYAAESRAGGAIDLLGEARIKYEEAQTKYEQVKELNRSGELDLLSQITVIGKGLKAVKLDREARQLASEGKMPEAETKFDDARKMEPETNRYYPSWYLARRVGEARATRAESEGNRLAKEGKIPEALEKFELVVRLKKEVELAMRQRLLPFICPFTPEEMVKQVVSPQADEADEQGRDLAAQGKTKEASEKFQKARDLTRNVSNVYAYDPVKEAKQAAANAKLAKADRLLIEVSRLVQERRSDRAQTKLEEAKSLDPSVTCAVKDFEDRNSARQLVEDGIKESREHNLQGAIAKFRKAKELNPDLELDPAQLAWRHEARAYLDEARCLAPSDPNAAKTALEKGLGLTARLRIQEPGRSLVDDPEKLLRLYPVLSAAQINLDPSSNPTIRKLWSNGFIDETRSVYERACVFDPLLEVPASFWNNLSWHAAIRGVEEAKRFKFASDLALAIDPAKTEFRDTRGLVRAMLGDRQGAIKDFEFLLWSCPTSRVRRERKAFIALLRSETPIAKIFTPEVLERLKGE